MKNLLVGILILVISITCLSSELDVMKKLFVKDADYSTIFAPIFLKQVPADKIAPVLIKLGKDLGEVKELKKEGTKNFIIFEKGRAPYQISFDKKGLINGFFIGVPESDDDTLEKVIKDLKKISENTSVCVMKDGKEIVLDLNSKKPLAVGSAFKLYVLKALDKKIKNEISGYNQILRLKKEGYSLPSGMLQNWPEGTPMTIRSIANLMISISDNTAADHLIDYVGRKKIEEVLPVYYTKPFLKTSEMFKLKSKGNEAIIKEYIRSNETARLNMLKKLQSFPLEKVEFIKTPTHNDKVEWHISTHDLCKVIYEMKDNKSIQINTGLLEDQKLSLKGYKGGSEPGVMNMTHVFQKDAKSPVYSVSCTFNSRKTFDQNEIAMVVSRLIKQFIK